MANLYYTPSGTPGFQTRALSSQQRNEDASVSAGFDKLPAPAVLGGSAQNYAVDTGTVNALIVTLNPQITVPFDGMELVVRAKNAPSGPATVLAGALMIANVTRSDGTPIKPNDWASDQIISLRYNATTATYQFQPSYNGTVVPPGQQSDAAPQFVNASDATKLARIDLSQLSTGTTRTITLQDRDMVLGKTFLDRSPRAANVVLTKADQANLIDFTSGGFTQTFAASSALGRGWWAYLQNSGAGDVEVQAPAAVSTTSPTSNSIAAGTTWTLATGLTIGAGDTIVVRRTADPFNQRVTGFVASYNSGTGATVVNVIARVGSGTFTDWSVTTCPVANAIDGLPSYVIYPGELRLFYVPETGIGIRSNVLRTFYRKATSGYAFICPPGYRIVGWDGVGGAGGAGSGSKGSAAFTSGGSPGGAPARIQRRLATNAVAGLFPGYSYSQSIGAAGASGAAVATNSTNGQPGAAGGNTALGNLVIAYGGAAGLAGVFTSLRYGQISGSGLYGIGSAIFSSSSTQVTAGGAPNFRATDATTLTLPYEEGGAGVLGASAYHSIWGGASAAVDTNSGTVTTQGAGSSSFGVAAGGWGGSLSNAGAALPAIPAGLSNSWTFNAGAAAGTSGAVATAGGNGVAPVTDFDMGNPGGGGGASSSATASAGRGGNGVGPGAPGGGGGACLDGTGSSGAGGTSQPGQSITWGEI